VGWKLDSEQRIELLHAFPPQYDQAIADHVTLYSAAADEARLPVERNGKVVGRADDGVGVEALVVSIGGTTGRPDGGTYHITWSLAAGRQAKESNDVIGRLGWEEIGPPVPLLLYPARFP
jgi:hypothetical protein